MEVKHRGWLEHFRRSTEFILWLSLLGLGLVGWLLPLTRFENLLLLIFLILAAILLALQYHWVRPRFGLRPWVHSSATYSAILVIALFSYLYRPYAMHSEFLYMIAIADRSVRNGRKAAQNAAVAAAILQGLVTWLAEYHQPLVFLAVAANITTIGLVGYAIAEIGHRLHIRNHEFERQNRHLSILLNAGALAASPLPLPDKLHQIAEMIALDVPVTVCRICLLDDRGEHLVNYGLFPLRQSERTAEQTGNVHALADLPEIRQILEAGVYQLLNRATIQGLQKNPNRSGFYFDDMSQVCVFPLVAMERTVGSITVGEARRVEREPFNQEKIDLLNAISRQIASAIHISLLAEEAQRHARRLDMVNEVARAISSTIEMDDLLELLYQQLSIVIPCDSYFISLYEPEQNVHNVRILMDDGVRFPPARISIRAGLASWVMENRQPLKVDHISRELDRMPVRPAMVGKERLSESWLGAPMLVGDRYLGLLSLGSYTPNTFSHEDLDLLVALASQAALSLDNARQHEEVKEQSRRDGLTGVYNHGYFLKLLGEAVERSRADQSPVSLIMLDIDYFKQYNDQYGHVTGDEVLVNVSQAIQMSLGESGFAGRWGGEEFAVALPGMLTPQAADLAVAIRTYLAQKEVYSKDSRRLKNPTVSQGIATFPFHAATAPDLVDVADQALYRAKNAGRDQIIRADPPQA